MSTLTDECANPECKRYLVDLPVKDPSRSQEDPRYCVDCGDLFWSFQPRSLDYPYRIPPVLCYEGAQLSAEQCDNCGGDNYTLKGRNRIRANGVIGLPVCAQCDSCGVEWPIVLRPGRLIVW